MEHPARLRDEKASGDFSLAVNHRRRRAHTSTRGRGEFVRRTSESTFMTSRQSAMHRQGVPSNAIRFQAATRRGPNDLGFSIQNETRPSESQRVPAKNNGGGRSEPAAICRRVQAISPRTRSRPKSPMNARIPTILTFWLSSNPSLATQVSSPAGFEAPGKPPIPDVYGWWLRQPPTSPSEGSPAPSRSPAHSLRRRLANPSSTPANSTSCETARSQFRPAPAMPAASGSPERPSHPPTHDEV